MHFLSPAWLALLLVVLAFAVAYVVVQLRRKKYVARFSNLQLLATVAPRRPGWRRHLTFALLLIGMTVLSVGAARPTAVVKVPRERATVMLAIDVSLSMEATDVLPSRIAAAQASAKEFMDLLPPRINVGLVSFGGNASVLVPPTLDRNQLKIAIDKLQLQESTAIGEAVFTCLDAIRVFGQATTSAGEAAPPARIVLMSDGANNRGRTIDQAISAAKQAKVEVSTIAFGTPTGTVTYQGETIPVPPDESALQGLAQGTGGSFHTAYTEQSLKSVFNNIGSQIGYTKAQRDISWRFLILGVLFVMAAAGTSMLWAGRLV
jgi:Ca-activated chloride channel family protein